MIRNNQTIRNRVGMKFIRLTAPLLFLLMILACDSDNPICGIDGTAVEENGIILTLRQKSDSPPAHVSVLLKADMKSDVGRNVPLTNLRASNFTIFENDSRISVESDHAIVPKPGVFISHTLLLLDLSGSILEDSASLEKLKDASTKFIDAIIPASNSEGFGEIDMAIDWFDGEQKLHQLVPFTTNADALRDGIKRIREGISRDRSTNLNGAVIDGAKKVKDMTGIEDGVVSIGALAIFTDGKDQAARKSQKKALEAVDDASQQSVSIYTVGLGNEIDKSTLRAFGKDGFFFADDIEELAAEFEEIATQINDDVNSHYLVEYCSPKRNGDHSLKIVVSYQNLDGSITTCFDADDFRGGCELHKTSILARTTKRRSDD